MAYNRSAMGGYYAGDPFLGGLIKGAGKLIGGAVKTAVGIGGSVLPGPAGAAMKAVGGLIGGGRIVNGMQPPSMPGMGMGQIMGPASGAGRVAAGLEPRVTKSGTITTRKRPRMDPNNTRALRRAIRRVEAHVRQEQRLKKTMGKVASHYRPRRGARRDLGRGHVHVR